jgi:hypothetical protein
MKIVITPVFSIVCIGLDDTVMDGNDTVKSIFDTVNSGTMLP